MVLKFYRRFLEAAGEDGAAGGGERRPSPAEQQAQANRARLDRVNQIGRVADGRRAADMMDVDGERPVGRFADGELDNSEGARARQADVDADKAEEARLQQQERDRQAQEEEDRDEAQRLQEEGGEGGDERGSRREPPAVEGDEQVIDGVRYYKIVVGGSEKWLTLKQLRESAGAASATEETLQRAQDALRSAAQAQLTPKEAPAEELSESDLENVILSASMGDEEAVKKLASELRRRPKGTDPKDVSRLVAQQIATQREVDRAEQAQDDLLGNEKLAPIFRMRLAAFANAKPTTKIGDAYKVVGDEMRKDFAPMLSRDPSRPNPNLSKQDRKRTIVSPPQGAGRQPRREDDDREVPVSEQIDAIARSRGQGRAHRIRRS